MTLLFILNIIMFACICVSFYCTRKANKLAKEAADTASYYQKKYIGVCKVYLDVYTNGYDTFEIVHSSAVCCYLLCGRVKDNRVIIKRFDYDPFDEDSKDYAYRCAEELKEKLEEEL